MNVFYRAAFATLFIELGANEELGILDTSYLEDFDGNDGQVTAHHVGSSTDYAVTMVEVPGQTPGTPNDYFRGQLTLASIPDGSYEIRGRCRDTLGNYSIFGSVSAPIGSEDIRSITFQVVAGQGILTYLEGAARIYGASAPAKADIRLNSGAGNAPTRASISGAGPINFSQRDL